MKKPKFTKEQMEFLREILTPPCCHVSGEHDPTHFREKPARVCYIQKQVAYDHALVMLRIGSVPGKSKKNCYWCSKK